jgi:3-deoxy-manno-octulosonate cytidylyltransferase (CMP-KDO synthetase)
MKAIGIIPARYQSTRFPGKPLALIGGKEMLKHVFENVSDSGIFARVVIATDDHRIKAAAESWGATVVITHESHPSGTDRCAEVIDVLNENFDIVVNIQGDEPFISKKPLQQLLDIFEKTDAVLATLVHKIDDVGDLWNENIMKVVLTEQLPLTIHDLPENQSLKINEQSPAVYKALYFSRNAIPFIRGAEKKDWLSHYIFWKHIGLYAYRTNTLKEIVKLAPGNLEKAESLEQLRWLENGYDIHISETDYKMLSIDIPTDLQKAEKFFLSIGG